MARRVLYVCHNHPTIRPGGSEAYALDLHREMRTRPGWDSLFLARSGRPLTDVARYHEGTLLTLVDGTSDEYFFHTELSQYDTFHGWSTNKNLWTHYFRDFLKATKPDVVHFHHTLFLGFDMIREVRSTLPGAAIAYTLHEFIPICHRNGQMVRTFNDDELCTFSSPRRCHECFPEHSPQAFFMRERFIKSMFELVDMFIAPSEFLRKRYIDWGIPAERIRFEENGIAAEAPEGVELGAGDERAPNRLGFFGQITRYKGVHVLLEAMQLLAKDEVDVSLTIHGANLELEAADYQKRLMELLDALHGRVRVVGRYERSELPALMSAVDWVVMPSIWWENSPLVIQEAFQSRKPVICSDIGGMAEKVTNGVNGLHFRARDAVDLMRTIRSAVQDRDGWRAMQTGIPAVRSMKDHATFLTDLYADLIGSSRAHQPQVVSLG